MDPTRDDELAQRAPLVPEVGRAADTRTDGGRTTDERRGRRRPPTDAATRRAYDDELAQEAPVVPDLGRRPTAEEDTSR